MLPSVVAHEVTESVEQFLRDAFPIATTYFQRSKLGDTDQSTALVDDLVRREGALFKGPYLDIRLPFRKATAPAPFKHLQVPFEPFEHQQQAFSRLVGENPKSTIVATGTGSGKTECFMLPVIEDCLIRRERGIKTIIIYPMNALAADQARRFAAEVSRLGTRITVGMYVGGQKDAAVTQQMSDDHVITHHETLRQNPPDILLTNYKMLDFLLIRPEDQPLWRHNQPGTLKYLVVDELHTFDGAQGTDLACLIRRLRDRLGAGAELACVGTSATMGSGSSEELLDYARAVFAADFDADALIGEDRLTVSEYLRGADSGGTPELTYFQWPDAHDQCLDAGSYDSAGEYLKEQALLWFTDEPNTAFDGLAGSSEREAAAAAVVLGEHLRRHQAFHELLRAASELIDTTELVSEWQNRLNLSDSESAERLLSSLTALVAAARVWSRPDSDDPRDWCAPFLHVRQQLWLRELRRMVCSVPAAASEPPSLAFADDLTNPLEPLHLPLVHCRECHLAAWGASQQLGSPHLSGSQQAFYQEWFQRSNRAVLLVPLLEEESPDGASRFCPHCLLLQSDKADASCANCGKETLRVWVPEMLKRLTRNGAPVTRRDERCPSCGAHDTLTIVGYRAATLISVMAGRLFGTPYNDDRKLIAFSDSVQDAAHRAGFLGANNWRMLTRQALAWWLKQQETVTLAEMRAALPRYWQEELGSAERFCGTFTAPDMMWLREYRQLEESGKLAATSELPDMVRKRLAWEALTEFGRRGTVGRSLERTGSAAVGVDMQRLREDSDNFARRLREEVEALRNVPTEVVVQFVVGWLHHMRTRGAIYGRELDSYLSSGGIDFLFTRIPWMPGFGRGKRPPAAISLTHVSPNFETLIDGQRQTWSVNWLNKTLAPHHILIAAEAQQVYSLLLAALHGAGWLDEHYTPKQCVYLLNPERLQVTTNVAVARCNKCRHAVHFAHDVAAAYDGLPCLRSHCSGHLGAAPASDSRATYGRTQPYRLVPHEHTGLLTRELRERVEESFISGTEPWDYNLLSATPTLEMGIDIGALSTALLASVPPAQANYVQRVGRAGRRDGNSLAITVANGRNHDLFFFTDPLEMMSGDVATPGVFLRAQAVLERQLVAYCFDRWAAAGTEPGAIPRKLRQALNSVEHNQQDRFPHTLFRYIRATKDQLLPRFFAMFDELGDDAHHYLSGFLEPGSTYSFEARLLERLHRLSRERLALRRQVDQLRRKIAQQKKAPSDEAMENLIREMEGERSALFGLMASLNDQSTLNFLTDEGVLPNYAFPEEGVTLQSVILRGRSDQQAEQGGRRYDRAVYSFQRPAQAALGELAPEATFYAVNHKLTIDRVDLSLSEPEEWRFCNLCQYSANVTLQDQHSACPECGSPQWANIGQKHEVLRLRQVYSTESDRRSRIGDDSEQRDPLFFNRQMLVEIPPGGDRRGWRLKNRALPFGFEFLQKVVLREVNFGEAGGEKNVFTVAGEERPRRGFRLCRHCGTVQVERPRKDQKQHTFTCKLHDRPEQATEEDFLGSLYLYRELESEALRILLPLSEVAYSDSALNSFVAALNLGLRLHFRGSVHHLQVTQMKEPATEESGERVFLLIYDRIPGGTGYLKDLMRDPDNVFDMLAHAHAHLIDCPCAEDITLDGCYRCLLAYRDSRHMPSISRATAARLLGEILAERGATEPTTDLSSVSTNPLIESALEQMFIDALSQLEGAQTTHEVYRGKVGKLLTLPGPEGSPVAWHVEHQARLGPAEGVAVHTEVDVLLTPARDAADTLPIAVYMDGLQYHRRIVNEDVQKRLALLASGNYWVLSLGWDDLPTPAGDLKPVDNDLMKVVGPHESILRQACTSDVQEPRGALAFLDEWLRAPRSSQHRALARARCRAFTLLRNPGGTGSELRESLASELLSVTPEATLDRLDVRAAEAAIGGISATLTGATGRVGLVAALPLEIMQQALQEENLEVVNQHLRCHLWFDDRENPHDEASPGRALADDAFKIDWRAFWSAANQLQFLTGFTMATRQAVENGELTGITFATRTVPSTGAAGEASDTPYIEPAWQEVLEVSVLDGKALEEIRALGVPAPEVGVDLTDAAGAVVLSGSEAELVWRKAAIVVRTGSESAVPDGWTAIDADSGMVDALRLLHEGGAFQ